ncbi:MAG TPA: sulfur oxidation c-type cytochrome SoxX [Thiobacillaceae bacterium]|nr:sulfur oxidation c-type cytochrome SoxX [Thiobacillaceae bacterium]HNH88137.1 sulfur oxidation c-type cytochrome SoxX [Thiobacillaceae bacterium]
MRCLRALAWLALFGAAAVHGADPPPDAAVNPAAPSKTLEPKVVVNSGRLEWVPYKRDLTPWPTLSHEDKRPTVKPRKVKLSMPLNGDPARGREIALRPDRGYCVVCHQVPGEDWPGTVGTPLLHFKQHDYADGAVFQQIFDPRVINPQSVMPPYGANGILTEQDIRDLVAYLQSIE